MSSRGGQGGFSWRRKGQSMRDAWRSRGQGIKATGEKSEGGSPSAGFIVRGLHEEFLVDAIDKEKHHIGARPQKWISAATNPGPKIPLEQWFYDHRTEVYKITSEAIQMKNAGKTDKQIANQIAKQKGKLLFKILKNPKFKETKLDELLFKLYMGVDFLTIKQFSEMQQLLEKPLFQKIRENTTKQFDNAATRFLENMLQPNVSKRWASTQYSIFETELAKQ